MSERTTGREEGSVKDTVSRVSSLLHEAGETHHQMYRIVDGDDPD